MNNEKLVSPYVPSQFPATYRENSLQFVAFAQMYYEWLESPDQAVGRAKRLEEYRDIDETLEEFIIYFKNKYLPFFKFDTATDKRMIIKHVLDLYRAKGTQRGVDLFFRLVYGTAAEVYYPSTDLFRLSDNQWVKKQYLELSQHPTISSFPGKKVIGKRSGATAFAEKYVVKKVGERYAYVLYISNIEGQFQTGEQVYYGELQSDTFPFIVGSLNTLDITSGSDSFKVGDLVELQSDNGSGGRARVSNTVNTTGIVNFDLLDGGWGYTACSVVYVSEKVLSVSGLTPDLSINNLDAPGYSNNAFFLLENVVQPMANVDYQDGTANVTAGDSLTSYYSNGTIASTVKVLRVTQVNSTSGNLMISLVSGNSLANTYFYSPSNAYVINVNSYTDKTATGKVIGEYANQTLYVTNAISRFPLQTYVYQSDSKFRDTARGILTSADYSGTTGILRLTNVVGAFNPNANVSMRYANGVNSGSNAYLTNVTTVIGVANITGTFVYSQNAYFRTASSNTTGNVTFINNGDFATFALSPYLSFATEYSLYTDFLRANSTLNVAFMSTALDATDYGFPKAVAGSNSSTVLGDAFNFFNGNVGTITALTSVNPGKDYDAAPFVFIYDPYTSNFLKRDYTLTVNLISSNFSVGEIIEQENGAKGLIKEVVNTSTLAVRRTSLYIDFDKNYSNTIIVGGSSGATATLTGVSTDYMSLPAGENAVVTANVVTANGVVIGLDVIDSGFNYVQNETVNFVSEDGERAGTAKVNTIRHGTSQGTFITQDSFLSDGKYLFDGYYYQEYSYDIKTAITKQRFEDIYKQTMHLAGTQLFSTFVHTSVNPMNINASLPEGANTQPV